MHRPIGEELLPECGGSGAADPCKCSAEAARHDMHARSFTKRDGTKRRSTKLHIIAVCNAICPSLGLVSRASELATVSRTCSTTTSSTTQCQARIHRSTHIAFLCADDVFDDFAVEVGEHALEGPAYKLASSSPSPTWLVQLTQQQPYTL